MAYNLLRGDRDQPFLLPPNLRDWLPQDHLAWFILDVVDQLDLGPFLRGYRADGHGHPPTTPRPCSGCCCTAMRPGCAPRGSSGGAASRIWPSGCWPATRPRPRDDRALPGPPPAGPGRVPPELASPSTRLARLRTAKARLEAEAAERQRRYQQRVAELAAAARAKGRQPRAHIKPRPRDEAPNPKAVANATDPDSRFLHTSNGTVQGYNAQAVVTEHQVVVAAALTRQANDLEQLEPMLQAVDQALAAAEIPDRPARLLADSGSWSIANLTTIPDAPELLVWPAATGRTGKPRKDGKPQEAADDLPTAALGNRLGEVDQEGLGDLRGDQLGSPCSRTSM